MLIDWFTVGAQALNFLILVWLMKRFLYKPILAAIDAREARIASELADAAAKQADAKKQRDAFAQKNDDFNKQKADLLTSATHAAEVERKKLMEQARAQADAAIAARHKDLARDAAALSQNVSRCAQQQVFAIARKTLNDLADADLESRIVDAFVKRVRDLAGTAKDSLKAALLGGSKPALVRSSHELSDAQRRAIQDAINVSFASDVRLRFETSPELVSGIELSSDDQKIAWSISDYLTTLEQKVGALLSAPTKPETTSPETHKSDAKAADVAGTPA